MFTGIIESLGQVKKLSKEGSNLRLEIATELLAELKIDQSISHNGVCLTVEKINRNSYEVVAVKETLDKTNLSNQIIDDLINLERCMKLGDRLDGHIVQGHVDEIAVIENIETEAGSWLFSFKLNKSSSLIVEKGSICINGTSLTAFDVTDDKFKVTIIPYTYQHTSFKNLKVGDSVNLEFDIVGKYIQRMATNQS